MTLKSIRRHKIPVAISAGFTLIEVAIVLLIIGLVLGIGLQASVAFISTEKRKITNARLSALDTVLANYVAQNRRLPCPADGRVASGQALAGVEQRLPTGLCTMTNFGVIPWVTLGIAETDAQDGWNNRFTYRVYAPNTNLGFTSNQALDMTNCDPAGIAIRANSSLGVPAHLVSTCQQNTPTGTCNLAAVATCTSPLNYLLNRGIQIQDGSGNIIMDPALGNGAAYVIISHGDNGFGAYNSAGILQAANGPAASALEIWNSNGNPLRAYYNDAPFIEGVGVPNIHFDDILSRPSVMSVLNKAQLGPRAHLQ